MTFDQKIQILNSAGTWFAGLATFAVAVISLYLASRSERVKLAGRVAVVFITGEPDKKWISVKVTNVGLRNAVIDGIGWTAGKGRDRIECIQTFNNRYSSPIPIELQYDKAATFIIPLGEGSDWPEKFAKDIGDLSDKNLRTLRALAYTSVGKAIKIKPENSVVKVLKACDFKSTS